MSFEILRKENTRMIRPYWCFVASLVALTTCAEPGVGAAEQMKASLEGHSVVLVRRPDPGFVLMSGGDALAGALAFAGPLHDTRPGQNLQAAGRKLTAEYHIDDPAAFLSEALLSDLVGTYKLRPVTSDPVTVSNNLQLDAYRNKSTADLLFEFYTVEWRTFYFFLDFKHYEWYHAKAFLIDRRTGAVVRNATCAHKPVRVSTSPTFGELLANDAERLRASLEEAKSLCLATVRREFEISSTNGT